MITKRIVFLGDSITWGFPWGPSYSWVNMLKPVLRAQIINEGINGNTTSDMLRRFDRAVLRYEPTHVVISGGINDVVCGESFDRISFNFREMAAKAQEEGVKVIFGTPTAVDDSFWEIPLIRLREWMAAYARKHGIALIPFHEAFYDNGGKVRSELLLADGGHPAKEGYRLMFEIIDLSVFD